MFTGIITDTTSVRIASQSDDGIMLAFKRPKGWNDLVLGESIASNGVCLTVAEIREEEYDCFVIPESLEISAFGQKIPDVVNLERSLSMQDRFGGHFVQGHIDGVGTVKAIDNSDGLRITITFDPANRQLIIYKGSITINGVALTVSALTEDSFEVSLIPHTADQTTMGSLSAGDLVNLEYDVLGKYVLNSLQTRS